LKRLSIENDAIDFMQAICEREEITFTTKLIKTILRVSEGNPRKILKALYLAKHSDVESLKELLKSVDEDDPDIKALCRCMLHGKSGLVDALNAVRNKEPETVRRAVLSYMQKVIMNPKDKKYVPRALDIAECFSEFPANGFIDIILATFESVGL
jgi:DNA polymerase III gamma/tau subunit